jgi:glycerol-3-phosphate dehydrogenase (NAD(P)+)
MKLAIIGAGGWGTALACVLSQRFDRVGLWVNESDLAARMRESRINDLFLPGITLPPNIDAGHSLEATLEGAAIVLSAMPSHAVRDVYSRMAPFLDPAVPIVSCTKGLERGTLLRVSEIIREVMGADYRIAVLSGPTFAIEVASGSPTLLVIASEDTGLAEELQRRFYCPTFRPYANCDPTGVEIGGALKNVIAIGAGICDGLGLGRNAVAALITRGLAELTRLAVAAGGRAETMSGLAGLGDLVLTCTGDLSRNRQVGLKLAAGIKLESILNSSIMVVEGVQTTGAALELAHRLHVDLPITAEMAAVLNGDRSPAHAIARLMSRALTREIRNN